MLNNNGEEGFPNVSFTKILNTIMKNVLYNTGLVENYV